MPLLRSVAESLSQTDLQRGVIEEIIDRDALFAALPFVQTKGKSYDYNREGTPSEGDFIDAYQTVPEGALTVTPVSTKLKVLAGQVLIDNYDIEVDGDTNDQVGIQVASKAKALARKFRRTVATGDATANALSFNGLPNLVDASMVLSAGTNGAALTFSMMDQLSDLVINGADCFVAHSSVLRAYRALLRATGGLQPAEVMMENFGQVMLTHNGIPFIPNDFLPVNETQGSSTTSTSVYAARLNEVDGLHGIWGGEKAGIRLEQIGTHQSQDAQIYRLKWYVALALKSTMSLARLKGINVS